MWTFYIWYKRTHPSLASFVMSFSSSSLFSFFFSFFIQSFYFFFIYLFFWVKNKLVFEEVSWGREKEDAGIQPTMLHRKLKQWWIHIHVAHLAIGSNKCACPSLIIFFFFLSHTARIISNHCLD